MQIEFIWNGPMLIGAKLTYTHTEPIIALDTVAAIEEHSTVFRQFPEIYLGDTKLTVLEALERINLPTEHTMDHLQGDMVFLFSYEQADVFIEVLYEICDMDEDLCGYASDAVMTAETHWRPFPEQRN